MELELDTNDPRNKQAVSDMMDEIASFIFTKSQELLVQNRSVDTGYLLGSGGMDLTDKEVKLIHYRVSYAVSVEYGRDPGSMPPVSALEPWVRRKLRKRGREITSTAWAIAVSLKKHGHVARPFLRPALSFASTKFGIRGMGVAAEFG